MQGDPFGAVKLIDRAKLYVFGLRDWFLGMVESERKQWEAARAPVIERDSVPAPYSDCPTCHTKESMRECAAGTMRCSSCGWQPRIVNAPGISRSDLDKFSYPDAAHKRKFQQGFGQAVARITPGRK